MTEALDAARSAYSKWYTIQSRVAVLANAFLLRHRDLRLLAVSTSRQVQSFDAQVSMFYGCISAKATTCANTYGELAVPLKKKRE